MRVRYADVCGSTAVIWNNVCGSTAVICVDQQLLFVWINSCYLKQCVWLNSCYLKQCVCGSTAVICVDQQLLFETMCVWINSCYLCGSTAVIWNNVCGSTAVIWNNVCVCGSTAFICVDQQLLFETMCVWINSCYLCGSTAVICVDQQLLFETIFALRSVTYSMRRMSYRLCGCLLAGTRWNVPASKQPQNLYDIHLILYVQS